MKTNTKNQDIFFGKAIKIGNSLGFIIPKNNVEFEGIVEGDLFRVWIKKEVKINATKEESNSR